LIGEKQGRLTQIKKRCKKRKRPVIGKAEKDFRVRRGRRVKNQR